MKELKVKSCLILKNVTCPLEVTDETATGASSIIAALRGVGRNSKAGGTCIGECEEERGDHERGHDSLRHSGFARG